MDVAICIGKSCRKHAQADDLRAAITGAPGTTNVVDTSCLSICKGPVLVVDPLGERPLVLSRVRSEKAIRDVRRVLDGREPSKRVRKRSVHGGKRAKAVLRAVRSFSRRRRALQ